MKAFHFDCDLFRLPIITGDGNDFSFRSAYHFKVPAELFIHPGRKTRVPLISPKIFHPGKLLWLKGFQEQPSAFLIVDISFIYLYCEGKAFSVNK